MSSSINSSVASDLIKLSDPKNSTENANMDDFSHLPQCTEDTSLIETSQQFRSCPYRSSIPSMGIQISPISILANSIDEGTPGSTITLKSEENLTKYLQSEVDSFNFNTLSDHRHDVAPCMEMLTDGDSDFLIQEKQDSGLLTIGNRNPHNKQRPVLNGNALNDLVSATQAFKEASHNQCELLRAQTSAINRLATAIEDQNIMMRRCYSAIHETNSNNLVEKDGNPSKK